jgi:rhamnosyl/mannosyltransferase
VAVLRIVHVYKNYDPIVGGIENHIKVLAEAEAGRGDRVQVLVTNATRRTVRENRNGVEVIRAGRVLELASTPLSPAMLVEAARLNADVVNLHMPFPPGDLVARAVAGNPALVVTYHSDIVRQRRLLQVYRPILQATLSAADRIIVTSGRYRDSSPFLMPRATRCRVVPLSVDATRFTTIDPAGLARLRERFPGPLLLSVGVLRYYKGLHILLEALPALDATLVIVGTGPEEERLKKLADDLQITGRVHFAGYVPDADLPTYYQAADIFVLPSHLRSEAFGTVLIEAMAAGLPLVTAEIGTGTSEVNEHGQTGFVVAREDPAALVRALQVLIADQGLRERFGQEGRRRALVEYAPALMAARTEAVYREALEHRQGKERRTV